MKIKCVKQLIMNGTTYAWFVKGDTPCVSDSREYINYENGKTVAKEYPKERLPKGIQRYINSHRCAVWDVREYPNGDRVEVMIYR